MVSADPKFTMDEHEHIHKEFLRSNLPASSERCVFKHKTITHWIKWRHFSWPRATYMHCVQFSNLTRNTLDAGFLHRDKNSFQTPGRHYIGCSSPWALNELCSLEAVISCLRQVRVYKPGSHVLRLGTMALRPYRFLSYLFIYLFIITAGPTLPATTILALQDPCNKAMVSEK